MTWHGVEWVSDQDCSVEFVRIHYVERCTFAKLWVEVSWWVGFGCADMRSGRDLLDGWLLADKLSRVSWNVYNHKLWIDLFFVMVRKKDRERDRERKGESGHVITHTHALEVKQLTLGDHIHVHPYLLSIFTSCILSFFFWTMFLSSCASTLCSSRSSVMITECILVWESLDQGAKHCFATNCCATMVTHDIVDTHLDVTSDWQEWLAFMDLVF